MFFEVLVNGAKIYNNLLEFAPGHHSANHAITAGTHSSFIGTSFGQPTLIANNTIKGGATSGAIGTAFATVQGNVISGMGSYISVVRQPGSELKIDRNIFFGAQPTMNSESSALPKVSIERHNGRRLAMM